MLFNLTANIFAAGPNLANNEQKRNIITALNDAYENSTQDPPKKSLQWYQDQYEKTFDNYANALEQKETFGSIVEATKAAIQGQNHAFTISAGEKPSPRNNCDNLDSYIEKFYIALDAYNKKIEKLGGVDKIQEQINVYIKDLDDVEKAIEDQQKIIEINNKKLEEAKQGQNANLTRDEIATANKAIKTAESKIEKYKKLYSSKYKVYDKFRNQIQEIQNTEINLENESIRLNGLESLCDQVSTEALLQAIQNFPDYKKLLGTDEELSQETSMEDLLKIADKLLEKLQKKSLTAEEKYYQAESDFNDAYNEDLNKRIDQYLTPANAKICNEKIAEVKKYADWAVLGRIDGNNVSIEPGSVTGGAWGQVIKGKVHPAVSFALQKDANLACINNPWTESTLEEYNAGITMEELSYIKYGEYTTRFGLTDGVKITDEEAKEKAKKLAKITIFLALGDPLTPEQKQDGQEYSIDRATVAFYSLKGDKRQSLYLKKFLKQDWENKGYGTYEIYEEIEHIWDEEEGELGSEVHKIGRFEVNEANKDLANTDLHISYSSRAIAFYNTYRILQEYSLELNNLLINIMNYLAKAEKPSDLYNYLTQIGIPEDIDTCQDLFKKEDFEKYKDNTFEDLNKKYSQEYKENAVKQEIQKEPYNPIAALLAPVTYHADRRTSCARARRDLIKAFEWEKSQPIKNALGFNAQMLPKNHSPHNQERVIPVGESAVKDVPNIYHKNLTAWNAFAESLYEKKAQRLLYLMANLGHLLDTGEDKMSMMVMIHSPGPWELKPAQYADSIESSHHVDYTGLDLLVTLPLIVATGGESVKLTTGTKIAVRQMMKFGYKMALRRTIRSAAKPGLKYNALKRIHARIGKLEAKLADQNEQIKRLKESYERRRNPTGTLRNGGRFNTSYNLREESIKGSVIHQFEKKFTNFVGLDVQQYRSKIFPKYTGGNNGRLRNSFDSPEVTNKSYYDKIRNKISYESNTENNDALAKQILEDLNKPVTTAEKPSLLTKFKQGATKIKKAVVTTALSFSLINPYQERIFANALITQTERKAAMEATARAEVTNLTRTVSADTWITDPIINEERKVVANSATPTATEGGMSPVLNSSKTTKHYNNPTNLVKNRYTNRPGSKYKRFHNGNKKPSSSKKNNKNSASKKQKELPDSVTENKYRSPEDERRMELKRELETKKKQLEQESRKLTSATKSGHKKDILKNINQLGHDVYKIESEIAELDKKIPPVNKAKAEKSLTLDEIGSLKGEKLTQNQQVKNLMNDSNITPISIDADLSEVYNSSRNLGLNFRSKKNVNSYIADKSNGKFKSLNALNKALQQETHPLHNEALNLVANDPAFKDLEVIISKHTPGYATLDVNCQLRMPLPKFIANSSGSYKNLNIKMKKEIITQDGKTVERIFLDLEDKHVHGLQLYGPIGDFMDGNVLAVIRKSDHEVLIVFDRVKNNEYLIGIIQENPGRGVNLLTTNYTVKVEPKGFGEQFFTYTKKEGANGIHIVKGFNKKTEVLYLKQPRPTNYNQDAPNILLKDIRNIRNNTKIGTEYKMFQP